MSLFVLDVNVVLAAFRDDHAQHVAMRQWFEGLTISAHTFSIPNVVWASFLRLVTNRHAFPVPTPVDEAFAYVEAVRAQPNHRVLEPGPQHLGLLLRLCREANGTGDLVPDAVLAAIALEHGCAVASLDRDFARFTSIDHVIPAAA